MDTDFDVCIIGSGAGAGPVAYTLALQGKKVVVLEKGGWFTEKDFFKDEIAVCRRSTFTPCLDDEPQVLETLNSNNEWEGGPNNISRLDFWNGSMVGGSTNLMSGFFHRMKPIDFRLKSEFADIEGANVVDWPIDYDEMEHFFMLCEPIIGISGKVTPHAFLEPRSTPDYPYPPLAEHAITNYLDKASSALGYTIFPVARAILSKPNNNRQACSYSGYCGSYGCTTGAKGSSRAALLDVALSTGNCEIRPHSHVYNISSNSKGKIEYVQYFTKEGKKERVDAKIYVVACQAVETSRLLLLSKGPKYPMGLANNSGQVGKNLIFSAGGTGSCYFHRNQFNADEFELLRDIHPFVNRTLQDWYVINDLKPGLKMKGGTLDFLLDHANPIRRAQTTKWKNDKLVWGHELKLRLLEEFTNKVRLNFEVFCDWLPNNNCFIGLSTKVKDKYGLPVARIRLGNHPHDLVIGEYLAKKGEKLFEQMGAKGITSEISGSPPSNLMAGGCRFGNDPHTSVLDKNCRAHELENLYITDGSFMPTGGSVTYTWTIYANAFRVASIIAGKI